MNAHLVHRSGPWNSNWLKVIFSDARMFVKGPAQKTALNLAKKLERVRRPEMCVRHFLNCVPLWYCFLLWSAERAIVFSSCFFDELWFWVWKCQYFSKIYVFFSFLWSTKWSKQTGALLQAYGIYFIFFFDRNIFWKRVLFVKKLIKTLLREIIFHILW